MGAYLEVPPGILYLSGGITGSLTMEALKMNHLPCFLPKRGWMGQVVFFGFDGIDGGGAALSSPSGWEGNKNLTAHPFIRVRPLRTKNPLENL